MRRSALILGILITAAGCGPLVDQGPAGRGDHDLSGNQTIGPLTPDSDLSVPPSGSIFFSGDWAESAYGTLYQGGAAQVSVVPERFPKCGTSGMVTVGTKDAQGRVSYTPLDSGNPGETRWGTLRLPSVGRELEVWLKSERADGCVEWDSDFGRNYHFDIRP
jgi:hypothetical protein